MTQTKTRTVRSLDATPPNYWDNHIGIDVLYGSSQVTDDDRQRARDAAEHVIHCAGLTVADCYRTFRRQMAELDDYDRLHGAGRVWVDAERAADVALTSGWSRPDGAACSLRGFAEDVA